MLIHADNSLCLKTSDIDILTSKTVCCESDDSSFMSDYPSSPSSPSSPMSEASDSSSLASSFEVHTPPPHGLHDVPLDYVRHQLRELASNYWDKPHTADCIIITPVPQMSSLDNSSSMPPVSSNHDPSGLGRRVTAPATSVVVPRIVMKAHMDYLCNHSSLLRSLFSGVSPLDLIAGTARQAQRHALPFVPVPPSRLPRLLAPTNGTHPTLFLPVPDPSSLHLLVHYMYFRTTEFIRQALDAGVIQWEGVALNVEYLGMEKDLKVFLGAYWGSVHGTRPESPPCRSSRMPRHPRREDGPPMSDSDDDADDEQAPLDVPRRGRPMTSLRRQSS